MRDSGFVVSAVLSVEVDGAIVLGHDDFGVVIGQYFEFDDFTVQSS